jgi:excisionase family DNA binding protein
VTDVPVVTAADAAGPQSDSSVPGPTTRITLDEAAKQLGLSRSTINRWRRRGLLGSYRAPGVDRRVYIDREQLRALLRNPSLVTQPMIDPRRVAS